MVRTSILADAMNSINNADRMGKRQVLIRPASKVTVEFLNIMQKHGYVGEFEIVDDHRSGKIVVQLNGRQVSLLGPRGLRRLLTKHSLNKCGVISPRYNVKISQLEKWVTKLLPSRQFGHIVLTTSAGVMDHNTARRKHVSGKILGFFY
ncbi:40S ribosomal protein S22-like protein [Xylaria telfairii]|nr:40S ribosomal protein S22-like protein [Xylaria telfairii]